MHKAINLAPQPCMLVNAVLRHRPAQARDYITQRPFPYNIQAAKKALEKLESLIEI